ncbi:hypothetical protein FRC02_006504 [Tulasnella sp. 418]|nr:hypothetical protein FRC02_006504 [Tulasnella sp. 418]
MDGSKGNQGINTKDRSILGEKNMMDGCTNLGLGKDQEVNHDKLWSQDPSKGGYGLGSRNEKSQPFKPYRSSDIKGFDGGRKLRDHSNIDGTIGHWKAYIFNSPAEPWNGLSIGGVDPNGSRNSWNSQGGTYEPTRSQGLWPYLPEGCNSITAGYKEVFT